MNWLSRSKPIVLVVAATLGAFACGGGGGGGSSTSTNKGTIAIGIDLPESGAEASNGVPTMAGVKYLEKNYSAGEKNGVLARWRENEHQELEQHYGDSYRELLYPASRSSASQSSAG